MSDVAARPGAVAIGRWLLLLGGGVLLAGPAGAAVAVVVAAIALARLPQRLAGALGVLALVVVPAVVVAGGLPSPSTVSPTFASSSLVPHQLTFIGLALVGLWAVTDVLARRGGEPSAEPAESSTWLPLGRIGGLLVAGGVGVALVVASIAVLQT